MNTQGIRTILRQMMTEADDTTYDFLRVLACLGVLVYLVLACVNYATFEPINFGTGFGAVLLAAGGAVRLQDGLDKPEPPK